MPIPLRADFDAIGVRAAARKSKDGAQARRLLALAAIYEGATRTEAAQDRRRDAADHSGLGHEVQCAGPDGLIDRKAPGQPPRLNDAHRAALAAMIESGPIPAVHGVVRWRIVDLCQWLCEDSASRCQADAEPGAAGHGLSQAVGPTAPSCAEPRARSRILKKLSRARWTEIARDKGSSPAAIEIWFAGRGAHRAEEQDHATLGQARNAAVGAARPTHRFRLYLRRDLPEGGQRRPASSCPAAIPRR